MFCITFWQAAFLCRQIGLGLRRRHSEYKVQGTCERHLAPGVQKSSWKADGVQHFQMSTSDLLPLAGLGLCDTWPGAAPPSLPHTWQHHRGHTGKSLLPGHILVWEISWRWPLPPGFVFAEEHLIQTHLTAAESVGTWRVHHLLVAHPYFRQIHFWWASAPSFIAKKERKREEMHVMLRKSNRACSNPTAQTHMPPSFCSAPARLCCI